jgi:hypothetical protein
LTSFIECVSATGNALPPLVIFKGKSVQQQWFPSNTDQYKEWQFIAADNAWTSISTAIEWLQKVFIPQTTPNLSMLSKQHTLTLFASTYISCFTTFGFVSLFVPRKSLSNGSVTNRGQQ